VRGSPPAFSNYFKHCVVLIRDYCAYYTVGSRVKCSMELPRNMTFSCFQSSLSFNNLVSISLTVTDVCSRPVDLSVVDDV